MSSDNDRPIVDPPNSMTVADQRTVLFDHQGRPLTRKAGF